MIFNFQNMVVTKIMVLLCMIAGLVQAFFGNNVATATFWVAGAGFEIASAIYNQPIKLDKNTKEK
jgi:hypothetical protein